VFVLSSEGVGLLLKTPPQGSWLGVAWIAVTAMIGIVTLACGVQGWLAGRLSILERVVLIVSGLALVYPASSSDVAGLVGVAAVVVARKWLIRPKPA